MLTKKIFTPILATAMLLLSVFSAQAKTDRQLMPIELSISSATASVGEEICLDVFVEAGFDNIAAIQFSVNWDPAILQFQSVGLDADFPEGAIPLTFGTTMVANGLLAFSWGTVEAAGYSLPAGGNMFTVCFQVLATSNTTEVFFSDNPTLIDIFNAFGMQLEFVGNSGVVQIQANQPPVQFVLEEVQALEGAMLCVPIQVNAFQAISSMSFLISWDAALLEWSSLGAFNLPGFDEQNFQLVQPDENAFQVNWTSEEGAENLTNGSNLFEICFQVIGQAGQSAQVALSNVELENNEGQSIGVTLANGAILIETEDLSQSVGLNLSCETGISGQLTCIDVAAVRFNELSRMALSIRWPSDSLSFVEVIGGALPFWENVLLHTSQLDQGFLGIEWMSEESEGSSLPDGAVLFSLCFEPESVEGTATLRFSATPVPILIEKNGQPSPFVLENGKIDIYGAAVWPGDASANGQADQYDVLPIGLAFGAAGFVRPNASLDWAQQAAYLWEEASPVSAVNFAHADTDGNGAINFLDLSALSQNFGLLGDPDHPPLPLGFSDDNSDVILQMESANTVPGEVITLNLLLGDSLHPAQGVYGLAFELQYDTEWLEAADIQISFFNSWLGTPDNDLLTFARNDPEQGKWHIALCRNDGIPRTGQGIIAQLSIPIRSAIPQGFWPFAFQADRIRLIDEAENLVAVAHPPIASFIDNTVSSKEASGEKGLYFFPNPVRDQLYYRQEEGMAELRGIRLFSAEGQFIQQLDWDRDRVVWPRLKPAVYWILVQTEEDGKEWVYPLVVE